VRLEDDELQTLFGRLDDGALLGLWASLMAELNRRGVVRSDNNPIGDYCEFLVAAHYEVNRRATRTPVTTSRHGRASGSR
jgi:hypothetical protein